MTIVQTRSGRSLLLLLLIGLVCLPVFAQDEMPAAEGEQDFIVDNLYIEDVPKDDGSGLIIKWTPLPKDARIIEYRVYRGHTPDSLFFIGNVSVNVKTGFSGNTVIFFDKDFNSFMDIDSRSSIEPEDQQPEGSPIYKEIPRDIAITGPMLDHYTILGVIPYDEILYNARETEFPFMEEYKAAMNQSIDVEMDDPDYKLGLKVRQLRMAKKLKPYHQYWYSVIAVDEYRGYYPHCEPVSARPRTNKPEDPKGFDAAWVEDGNRLQFEWELPTEKADIYFHDIYMIPNDQLEAFKQAADYFRYQEWNTMLDGLFIGKSSDLLKQIIAGLDVTTENKARLRAFFELWNNRVSMDGAPEAIDKMIAFTGRDSTTIRNAFEQHGFPIPKEEIAKELFMIVNGEALLAQIEKIEKLPENPFPPQALQRLREFHHQWVNDTDYNTYPQAIQSLTEDFRRMENGGDLSVKLDEYLYENAFPTAVDFVMHTLDPETVPIEAPTVPVSAFQIFRRQSSYPYDSPNYAFVNLGEPDSLGRQEIIQARDKALAQEMDETVYPGHWFDPSMADDYTFAIAWFDTQMLQTFRYAEELLVTKQADMPVLPEFAAINMPNDKGDYAAAYWGKPVVNITKCVFTSDDRTDLRINYELNSNELYDVGNIYFHITDPMGIALSEPVHIDEFFQDNKILIDLDALKSPEDAMKLVLDVRITMDAELSSLGRKVVDADNAAALDFGENAYFFTQQLLWDDESQSMRPNGLLFLDQEKVSEFYYHLMKRSLANPQQRRAKSLIGIQRESADGIAYSENSFKQVTDYDVDNQLVFVSPTWTIYTSEQTPIEHDTARRFGVGSYMGEKSNEQGLKQKREELEEKKTAMAYYRMRFEYTLHDSSLAENPANASIEQKMKDMREGLTAAANAYKADLEARTEKLRKQVERINMYCLESISKEGEITGLEGQIEKIDAFVASLEGPAEETEDGEQEQKDFSGELAALRGRISGLDADIKELELETGSPVITASLEKNTNQGRLESLWDVYEKDYRSFEYRLVKTLGHGIFTEGEVYRDADGVSYVYPRSEWFDTEKFTLLIAVLTFGILVYLMIQRARGGHDIFIRDIAGIQEIDNAIGRATEMGRPILFVPGLSSISDVATLAGLAILGRVAKKAAEYDTRILVPNRDYIVLPIAQEIVREAHYEAGRPDTYDKRSVFFVTSSQFAFVAGVNGVMLREKTATNFYMGMFWAESLIMTETGSTTGAIQIAGTDAVSQLPFFITTCDYTLIGEELYAAAAYLQREPMMMGTLKAQDYMKFLLLAAMILGTAFSTAKLTFFIDYFPTH